MASVDGQESSEDLNRKTIKPSISPLADIISLETVVNVLVKKGICSAEELFEEERRRREYTDDVKGTTVVDTKRKPTDENGRKQSRRKQNWLKRKMSNKRWSRKLGTTLFGWQWKKVKIERQEKQVEHF